MEKELNKTAFTFIFTLVAFTASVLVYFSLNSGFGWFASNTDADAERMGAAIQAPEGFLQSIEYFEISSITLNSEAGADAADKNLYNFSSAAAYTKDFETGEETGNIPSLKIFSMIDPNRQILIKITLKDSVSGVKVGAKTSTVAYASPTANESSNKLSTIVQFSVLQSSEVAFSSNTLTARGTDCSHETFIEFSADGSIATDQAGNPKYDSDGIIEPKLNSQITDFGENEKAFYILLDYNEALARYIKAKYENNTENPVFTDKNGVKQLRFGDVDFLFIIDEIG